MFILILRELLFVVLILVAIWWVWDKIFTIVSSDRKKELIKRQLENIDTLEKLSKLPDIDPKKLQAIREKIKLIEKEGQL